MYKKKVFGFLSALIIFLAASINVQAQTPQQTYVGPTLGSISSLFGVRSDPFNGKQKFHAGLDIAASTGTPIYSLQEGYVVFSGVKGGYGKTVILKHEYSDLPEVPVIETLYGHCSEVLVSSGQYVKRGDVIALVGSTGRSTGAHLHFEVHYNGGYVNPIDYLIKLPKYLNYIAMKRSRYYAMKTSPPPKVRPHITAEQKSNYIMIEN